MKSYKYKNKIYKVKPCTLKDIPSHLEKVLSYLQDDEIEAYVLRMDEAVYNGTAYKLVDEYNNTRVFAYYIQKDKQIVDGVSLWWSSFRLFVLFGMWFRHYTNNKEVYIMPHKNNFISFKFLVDDASIKAYHKHSTSLLLDMYSIKSMRVIKNIYENMNIVGV